MPKKVLQVPIKARFRLLYMRHMLPFFINWQWRKEKPFSCGVENITVANRQVKLRIYTPPSEGPFPVLIYYHGGGFVLGNLNASDRGCRNLCRISGMVVVSVDYRLAPEFPFPIAVDDCLAAFDWVQANRKKCHAENQPVFVAGDSAGGNLAAVVTQQRKSSNIAGQVLLYPVVDFSVMNRPSYIENTDERWLTASMMKWFRCLYLPDEKDWFDVKVSPLLADSFQDLPPALVITAEFDPLRDEAELYARQMDEAGVPVMLKRFDSEHHGFYGVAGRTPVYEETSALIEKWLAER